MVIKRRKARKIKIGSIYVGGNAPIAIQSMAKTDTKDKKATVAQIKKLEKAGCEIVRVAVKDRDSAVVLRDIKRNIDIPLVADIHFDPKLAILAIESGVDKVRINPGNIRDTKGLVEVVKVAKKRRVPIRIGLNSGSLPKGVDMVESGLKTLKLFERYDFYDIIISLKTSNILTTIDAYRRMASRCDYPLHLGMTATGLPENGIVKSSICMGVLLLEGIGDTVRVSLTDESVGEVKIAKAILSSLRIRNFGPEIVSCPTCGRCQVDLVKIVNDLAKRLNAIPSYAKASSFAKASEDRSEGKRTTHDAIRPVRIAVMGCEVNGPGEAKDADIGIAAGKKSGVLFKKGKIVKRVNEKHFVNTLVKETRKDTNFH